jgi:hypothetical protein
MAGDYAHAPKQDAEAVFPGRCLAAARHTGDPGDFVRRPMMTPDAGRFGLELVEPTRSQVTVDGDLQIGFDNPKHAEVMAFTRAAGAKDERPCTPRPDGTRLRITCGLGAGQFKVQIYGAPAGTRSGTYLGIGSILANHR